MRCGTFGHQLQSFLQTELAAMDHGLGLGDGRHRSASLIAGWRRAEGSGIDSRCCCSM